MSSAPPSAASSITPHSEFHRRSPTPLAEYAESFLVTILLALFITTFIVQAFKIPSQSMEPTLLVGDHVLVNKFILEGTGAWYEKLLPYRPIRRGDIIVFKFPYDDHPHYVKRVIGLPGDHLRIIDGQVFVNGERLIEPYVIHDPAAEDPFGMNFPPTDRYYLYIGLRAEWAERLADYVDRNELVVPRGKFFVMGDNRDQSSDSRYWGFVDRGAIVGRPALIYWSVRATSRDYTDRGLGGAMAGIWESLRHLPSQTRWRRMLREVH
ncbi:MAG: signal peptidase I [Candidatus Acidiferrales bacterium]